MRARSQVGVPKRRCASDWRLLPLLRLIVASFVVLASAFQPTGLAQPIQQPKGSAVIVGVVVDENDTPVARAQVQAFWAEDVRKASHSSQRLGRSTGSASTDETGTFRISGLAAGDYVKIELVPVKPVRVTGTVISASGRSTEGRTTTSISRSPSARCVPHWSRRRRAFGSRLDARRAAGDGEQGSRTTGSRNADRGGRQTACW